MSDGRACATENAHLKIRDMRDRALTVIALLDSVDMLTDHIGIRALTRIAQDNLNELTQELKDMNEWLIAAHF